MILSRSVRAVRAPLGWPRERGQAAAAIVVLFLIGFGLIGLASAVDSTWPLFVTVIPYSVIPWLVVHEDGSPAAHLRDCYHSDTGRSETRY